MKRLPKRVVLPLLILAAIAAVAASLVVGTTSWRDVPRHILYEYRLPRGILAFLVGASLGASGVIFQGLFRNPLADPFVMGVSGGAALGAVACIVLGFERALLGLSSTTVAAFAGGLGAAFLAYRLARVRGRTPVASLLLAGFAIGSFCGALVSLLLLYSSRNWNEVIGWLMGNMGRADPWYRVGVVLPCAAAAVTAAMMYARDLNVLLLGEETAQQLGVESERVKRILLGAGAIAAAAAVSACGMIGFVGLIVPHIARRLVGPDHRTLLPVTVLSGGVLLTLADVGARAISPETPLPIGAVTALCGAPFFIYLLRRKAVRV